MSGGDDPKVRTDHEATSLGCLRTQPARRLRGDRIGSLFLGRVPVTGNFTGRVDRGGRRPGPPDRSGRARRRGIQVRGQRSEVAGRRSEVSGQWSEVRSQRIRGRGQDGRGEDWRASSGEAISATTTPRFSHQHSPRAMSAARSCTLRTSFIISTDTVVRPAGVSPTICAPRSSRSGARCLTMRRVAASINC